MSSGHREMDTPEIYRFPEFFDQLDRAGTLHARDVIESETQVDGIVYHHRGLQVPAYSLAFVTDPTDDGSSTFRIEVGAVGRRSVWAAFDRDHDWDVYVMLFDGGAVIAWMSDEEFDAEEADRFESKAAAILAGRFSFGAIFVFGPDWVEREEWAQSSTAPALLQVDTGDVLDPDTAEEFWTLTAAIPPEFREDEGAEPPAYLGLVDCKIEADST